MPEAVHVIGAGLAGVEAAYRLSQCGVDVHLFEMRPVRMTPAHTTDKLAELVCSNSLKGTDPLTAHGLLKKELSQLDSLVLKNAFQTRVPAGKALAVDREAFAARITADIAQHPRIRLIRKEVTQIDLSVPTIIATGPLTSEALASEIAELTGQQGLSFYDAIAPIIDSHSIDYDKAFFGSRWASDDTDYLNCPLDKEAYSAFINALLAADTVTPHAFEDARFFEGCLPIEIMARRGPESLRFGPMRPVGLSDPRTGGRPHAVVQLRRENLKGEAYNLVGFQTRLTQSDQSKVLRLIPALAQAQFLRYGSIHRNTFIDAPRLLAPDLSLKAHRNIVLAGQLAGVEGYMESTAMGIMAAYSIMAYRCGKPFTPPPPETAIGALIHHITDAAVRSFQPMNINFGIIPSPDVAKKLKRQALLEREALAFSEWVGTLEYRAPME
ncbi:MAG: methylenetetrahydrofolate--tRNA-(uracil(54)-C(5))-methyltransferase (FADH(2)-oxidizing) TrmFO [Syntrophaceae bacterium]